MNKEAPRTEEWIDRYGRGVLLNHRLCQTQHPDWSAADQIQRKKPETPVKPTRIRLNFEPNAGKSVHRTLGTHEQQSIWEMPDYTKNALQLIISQHNYLGVMVEDGLAWCLDAGEKLFGFY